MSSISHSTVSTKSAHAEGRILPPEILSLVFKNAFASAISGSLYNGLPVKLAAIRVCRFWRQVACENSELWMSVSLLFHAPSELRQIARILWLHLENSKDRPLDITLAFVGPNGHFDWPVVPDLVHQTAF
jgi:hypothetical protein